MDRSNWNNCRLRAGVGGLLASLATLAATPSLAQTSGNQTSATQTTEAPGAHIPDPWAGANRGLYKFSMAVDGVLFAPVVHGYKRVVPEGVRDALERAIDNLDEPRVAGNDILQGHPVRAGQATARFLVNSTFGLAGLFDMAGDAGLHHHDADFGQTLGRWGAATGPYIFIPFVGPSDIRDGVGRLVDSLADPIDWAAGGLNSTYSHVHTGLYVAQARVDIDDQLTGLKRDFTDPYVTMRSAYGQSRAFKVQQAKGVTPAQGVQSLPDFGDQPPGQPQPAPPAPAPHP